MEPAGCSVMDRSRSSGYDTVYRAIDAGAFLLFIVVAGVTIYYDDIEIGMSLMPEQNIYTIKILGLDILDHFTLALFGCSLLMVILSNSFRISWYHPYMFIIFCLYLFGFSVGFIYSYFFNYPFSQLFQDLQQVIYLCLYFLSAYTIINTRSRWRIFIFSLILFFFVKNGMIVSRFFTGDLKVFGEFAVRATQSSDNMIFPIFFFPALIYAFRSDVPMRVKIVFLTFGILYLSHSILGVGRTLFVVFGVCFYLVGRHIDTVSRKKLLKFAGIFVAVFVPATYALFPRFFEFAFFYKFLSIFDWSVAGDRSNATRTLEIYNVFGRVFDQGSFLFGMGLGSWWDDRFYRLLPDGGSGFDFKSRHFGTHLWPVTQILKIGFIGVAVYWYSMGRMLLRMNSVHKAIDRNSSDHALYLGLFIGLIASLMISADFVRLFMFTGIAIALLARYESFGIFADQGALR
jgi:hypothetical protein